MAAAEECERRFHVVRVDTLLVAALEPDVAGRFSVVVLPEELLGREALDAGGLLPQSPTVEVVRRDEVA
jgi:hypothetical protein